MPNFDQRGPVGEGPMTGRKMGRCTNYGAHQNQTIEVNENTVNPMNDNVQGQGLGRGMRRRMRRGMRNGMGQGNGMGQNRGGRGMGRSGGGGRGMGRRFPTDNIEQ